MKATEQDFALIRTMVELPYLIRVLDADMKLIDKSSLRTRLALLKQLDDLRQDVQYEMREVRGKLRSRQIKILKQTSLEDKLVAEYICRGYHDRMALMWSRVKCDIEEMVEVRLGAMKSLS
ncbi:hypothetical protein [Saccharibacillus sp. JS10]|uniref:hypothetical protein n=1 Tax=Saccharibacillus sp. JS10 TaxID=2950552 RepID=UPI002109562E|nr:hypothetical protein [Saccharibacillus sp. JS10]MCQ4085666.1 hypothetical protein [Saccharibacillus sp. JS10]